MVIFLYFVFYWGEGCESNKKRPSLFSISLHFFSLLFICNLQNCQTGFYPVCSWNHTHPMSLPWSQVSCSGNKTFNFYWFQSGNLNLKKNTFYICFTYCTPIFFPHPTPWGVSGSRMGGSRLRVWLRLLSPEGSMTWASRNNRDMGDIKSTSLSGIKKNWHCLVRMDRTYIHFLSGSLFLFPLLLCHYAGPVFGWSAVLSSSLYLATIIIILLPF